MRVLLAVAALSLAALTWMLIVNAQNVAPERPPTALALSDIVAFRRAVSHGAALARRASEDAACMATRRQRYAEYRDLFDHRGVGPGQSFGWRRIDIQADEDDNAFDVGPFMGFMDVSHGRIDGLSVEVARDRGWHCHASDDWAVECPRECADDALEACTELHRQLDRAWHASPRGVWKGWRGIRATLSIGWDTCMLRFERHVDEPRWIGLSLGEEIPIGLVGHPATWLPQRETSWTAAATGDYINSMNVEAVVEDGIVTAISAGGWQDDLAMGEIEELTRGLPVTISRNEQHYATLRAELPVPP